MPQLFTFFQLCFPLWWLAFHSSVYYIGLWFPLLPPNSSPDLLSWGYLQCICLNGELQAEGAQGPWCLVPSLFTAGSPLLRLPCRPTRVLPKLCLWEVSKDDHQGPISHKVQPQILAHSASPRTFCLTPALIFLILCFLASFLYKLFFLWQKRFIKKHSHVSGICKQAVETRMIQLLTSRLELKGVNQLKKMENIRNWNLT